MAYFNRDILIWNPTKSNALLNVYFAVPFAIDSVGVNGPPEYRRTAYGLDRVDRDKLSYWRT